ncbi:DUF2840 domain-containing protein [Novosphingobium sp. KN65.2]|uniref:DUF2840 domain-containing protein n=1 Tax=Novosphingobium sp. KN65.2 TaxID=1478134 RepID=UPI0005E86037|nr:DUF2840 domain-containing protein [Novosphingobium sp. KN65.2]CDO38379.1 conserved hypothetical protein [Novosphingobium sp. KN65.2]
MTGRVTGDTDFTPFARALAKQALTEVQLTWIEKRYEQWLRFGRVAGEQIVSRHTCIKRFRPGAVFALMRWIANNYGTVHSRIDIVQALARGEAFTTVPFVRPGGALLLSVTGWPKVEKVLRAIDAVEAAGVDPCDASPDHWRHVSARIAVGAQPRLYGKDRHEAWLKRTALGL